MKSKYCPRCKESKDIEAFARSRSKPDGRAGWCKECMRPYTREYRMAKLDHYRAANRAWNDRNLPKVLESVRNFNALVTQARRISGLSVKQYLTLSKEERAQLREQARQKQEAA